MAHYHEVTRAAAADATDEQSINDVIGSRGDAVTTNTLAGRIHSAEEHSHSASKVYPTLASAVTVTAAGDWVDGAFVEIIPADTVTNPFDVHYVNVEAVSAAREYELVLFYGAGDVECARVRITKTAGLDPVLDRDVQTPIIPANSRVRAKLASEGIVADTMDITLAYHEYT